jgi:hypothetical protein
MLHSTVARNVRWRAGRSAGPVPRASRLPASRASSESGVQEPDARGGDLDGQRQAVEPPANLGDGERVVLSQLEVAADGPASIDEQLYCGQRSQLLGRRASGKRRHRQRAYSVLALGAQAKHGAARSKHLELGAARQQLVELRRHTDDLLEVVQHEQDDIVADAVGHDV